MQMARERDDLLRHVSRHFESEPEKFIQLPAEDNDGNAAGESGHDRIGEELEQLPHSQRAEENQHHARHHRGQGEPVVAVNCRPPKTGPAQMRPSVPRLETVIHRAARPPDLR